MVVALDLERNRDAVAEGEDTRVLTRPLEHALALARQTLQEQRRVLVPAMLGPEEREDRELEVVGIPPEQLAYALRLPVGEPEGTMERLVRNAAQIVSLAGRSDPILRA